jgi:hypothetical protein
VLDGRAVDVEAAHDYREFVGGVEGAVDGTDLVWEQGVSFVVRVKRGEGKELLRIRPWRPRRTFMSSIRGIFFRGLLLFVFCTV